MLYGSAVHCHHYALKHSAVINPKRRKNSRGRGEGENKKKTAEVKQGSRQAWRVRNQVKIVVVRLQSKQWK